MKFKVGEKVMVRKDLKPHIPYYMADKSDYYYAVPDMMDRAGKIVTITEVNRKYYRIKGSDWKWTDEMFIKFDDREIKSQFKVGDKVRVKHDLKVGEIYYMLNSDVWHTVISDMLQFAGKVVTIKRVAKDYRINEGDYLWCDEMFEGLVEEAPKSPKLKVGQKLRLRKDLKEGFYGDELCVSLMSQHAGKIVTVKTVKRDNIFTIVEDLDGCRADWHWSLEMTEPIEELEEVIDYVLFDMSPIPVIPTKPIVVIPVISDSFTKAWMESFIERNGGMAVNG